MPLRGPNRGGGMRDGQGQQNPIERALEKRLMLPCRFFANGYCHRGNRCRYYHPSANEMTLALRVPPLPKGWGINDIFSGASKKRIGQGQGHGAAQSRFQSRPLNGTLEQYSSDEELDVSTTSTGTGAAAAGGRGLVVYEPNQEASTSQNATLFAHIDWENFLAPGVPPPPIVNVPEKEKRKGLELIPDPAGATTNTSAADDDGGHGDTSKKLSAKLELKQKFQELAKELASEPTPVARPLDSFFKQFPESCLAMLPESMVFRTRAKSPAKTAKDAAIGTEKVKLDDHGGTALSGAVDTSITF